MLNNCALFKWKWDNTSFAIEIICSLLEQNSRFISENRPRRENFHFNSQALNKEVRDDVSNDNGKSIIYNVIYFPNLCK